MSDTNITIEKKPNLFVRIAVIAGMLLILFFIAAAIVKYVPKIIAGLSPANVSLTSMFNGAATNATSTGNQVQTPDTTNSTNTQTSSSTVQAPAQTNTPKQTQTQPKTQTKTYTPAQNYTYTYTGPADLSISLLKVGQISTNGSFIQTSSIQPGSRVQVQFLVSNTGNSASGAWHLNAVLPTTIGSEKVYNSVTQPSIPRGASYQMTLAFDSYDGSSNIQITLTGGNDSNTANNILIVPLTSSGYNNNNGCYWSNGYQYCNGNNNSNNNGCYYLNGSYVCNNNNNSNNCYWSSGTYYCNNNYNNNNSCYWSNGSYYCNNNSNNNCHYSNGSYYCTGAITDNASDLSVTITNVGTMDRNTGQFYYTNSSSFRRSDKVAVQFTVTNRGGSTSNNWTFNANLPTSSSGTYSSNTQNSLAPGQTMSFTLGFEYPNAGTQNFSVQLYPQGTDTSSSNNYASRSIYIND